MGFETALTQELQKTLPNVFPLIAPEGTPTPYIVYKSSYGQRDHMLEGFTDGRVVDVDVMCVATSYKEMKDFTTDFLDRLLSATQIGTTEIVKILSVSYDQPMEQTDPITKERYSTTELKIRI